MLELHKGRLCQGSTKRAAELWHLLLSDKATQTGIWKSQTNGLVLFMLWLFEIAAHFQICWLQCSTVCEFTVCESMWKYLSLQSQFSKAQCSIL